MTNPISIQLPQDLFIYLSSFLGQKEIARCECVCKPWQTVFSSDPVWKRIYEKKDMRKVQFSQELTFKQKCKAFDLGLHPYPQLVDLVKKVEAKAMEIKKNSLGNDTPIEWEAEPKDVKIKKKACDNGTPIEYEECRADDWRPWLSSHLARYPSADNYSLAVAMDNLKLSKKSILQQQLSNQLCSKEFTNTIGVCLSFVEDGTPLTDSTTIRKLRALALFLSPNGKL